MEGCSALPLEHTLRELSEYGRMAKLWVRFKGENLGSRNTLHTDQELDPISDFESWIPAAPTHRRRQRKGPGRRHQEGQG
eukprot:5689894-Pyramimonas_sp.AAC.1